LYKDGKKYIVPGLVKKAAVFLFLLNCIFLFFYAAGVQQAFTDDTQLTLLRLMLAFGLILGIVSLYGIIFHLFKFFKLKNTRRVLGLLMYALFFVFGLILALGSSLFVSFAKGNFY
jgi:hypothetical protein